MRICGHRGHPSVRASLIRYASWLRTVVEFPVRVPVYLLPDDQVRTADGQLVSASIFLPWERQLEPYIRIATGDFPRLRRACGRDDALGAYLCSLSHEVMHYRQWIETGKAWERGVVAKARRLVDAYARTVNRP